MSNCDYNSCFKGINNISQDMLLNILEANFKMYLDWSFLKIGGWIDAEKPQETIYGNNAHYKLIPVSDMSYVDGQVWQGIRKEWVWETDISYDSTAPITITNVLVNGISVPKTNNFTINYPSGRLIFNNPVSLSATVELNYSYRFVQIHRSSDSPWFNIIQYSSFNTANQDIQQIDNGEWAIGSHHRVQ